MKRISEIPIHTPHTAHQQSTIYRPRNLPSHSILVLVFSHGVSIQKEEHLYISFLYFNIWIDDCDPRNSLVCLGPFVFPSFRRRHLESIKRHECCGFSQHIESDHNCLRSHRFPHQHYEKWQQGKIAKLQDAQPFRDAQCCVYL